VVRFRCLAWRLLGTALFVTGAFGAYSAPDTVTNGVVRVGTIEHFGVTESSGLAASRKYPGVIWTHNDGGFQFLFALDETGRSIGAFQVTGANLIDWEAIAPDDRGNLYLADIGTNGMARTHVAVHRVKEPNPYDRYGNAAVNRTWYLKFPGSPQDSEAFFVLNGYGYLITRQRTTNDQVGLFRFALADNTTSVPLELVASIAVTAGVTDAALSPYHQRLGVVTSEGVYLFFINGDPASINGARRSLTRFENSFMEGGAFSSRGFLTSAETRELWLFTGPFFACALAPAFTTALADRSSSIGGTVEVATEATGCPFPAYRWHLNGVPLAGQTNSSLALSNITAAAAGRYELIAQNVHGTATNRFTLVVRLQPDVRITEVLANPAPDATGPTADWWELTNFDSRSVDLSGWRFNDSIGELADPFVFGAGLTIAPGESIVFVENLSPAEFQSWWGETNLPAGLQIISYRGNGLSLRATGDTLLLWDNSTIDPRDTISSADFGASDDGVTFNYDPVTGQFGQKSQLGVNGVFRALLGADIGSPGRIAGLGPDLFLQMVRPRNSGLAAAPSAEPGRLQILFRAEAGQSYLLEVATAAQGPWALTGHVWESAQAGPGFFEIHHGEGARYFRVRR
jgi:hypothetical protein